MVEAGSKEVSEDVVVDALEPGHTEIRKIIAAIRELGKRVGEKKVSVAPPAFDEALYQDMTRKYADRLRDALDTAKHPKTESYALVDGVKKEIFAAIPDDDKPKRALTAAALERLREQIFREDMVGKAPPSRRARLRSDSPNHL